MSLKFVTKKLEHQRLAESSRRDQGEDSGTESDDERGDDDDKEGDHQSYSDKSIEPTRQLDERQSREIVIHDSVFPPTKNICDFNCDIDDNYSSEEELKEIIDHKQNSSSYSSRPSADAAAEKRKWSEMDENDSETSSVAGFVFRTGSSCEDEMFNGLSTPVQFRSSPPLDVYRPWKSPPKLFHISSDENPVEPELTDKVDDGVSIPNKRHRLTPRPHNIQRPCLDFEKMQQIKKRVVTSWRPQGTELSLFCW